MTIHASGRLRHCWFGDYSARIGLRFATPELAREAWLALLQPTDTPGAGTNLWTLQENFLLFTGGGQRLKSALAQLKAAGANLKKVDSLKHSIDYGEPFEVHISTVPVDDGSVQGDLLAAITMLDVHAGEQ